VDRGEVACVVADVAEERKCRGSPSSRLDASSPSQMRTRGGALIKIGSALSKRAFALQGA
jgi:hypothetical protein